MQITYFNNYCVYLHRLSGDIKNCLYKQVMLITIMGLRSYWKSFNC